MRRRTIAVDDLEAWLIENTDLALGQASFEDPSIPKWPNELPFCCGEGAHAPAAATAC
jgi:hypothetical protein